MNQRKRPSSKLATRVFFKPELTNLVTGDQRAVATPTARLITVYRRFPPRLGILLDHGSHHQVSGWTCPVLIPHPVLV